MESLSGRYPHGIIEQHFVRLRLFILLQSLSELDLDVTLDEAVWGCHWVVVVV